MFRRFSRNLDGIRGLGVVYAAAQGRQPAAARNATARWRLIFRWAVQGRHRRARRLNRQTDAPITAPPANTFCTSQGEPSKLLRGCVGWRGRDVLQQLRAAGLRRVHQGQTATISSSKCSRAHASGAAATRCTNAFNVARCGSGATAVAASRACKTAMVGIACTRLSSQWTIR